MSNPTEAAFKEPSFIPRDIAIERRDDGTVLMSSRIALELAQTNLPAYLRFRAQERPEAIWISQPDRAAAIGVRSVLPRPAAASIILPRR